MDNHGADRDEQAAAISRAKHVGFALVRRANGTRAASGTVFCPAIRARVDARSPDLDVRHRATSALEWPAFEATASRSTNAPLLRIVSSFEKMRCQRFLRPLNETLTAAPFPVGMVGGVPEAPISCSSRKAELSDGYGPCSTTSGPR